MSRFAVAISSCWRTGLPVRPISTAGCSARTASTAARIAAIGSPTGSSSEKSLTGIASTKSSFPSGARRYSRGRAAESAAATTGCAATLPRATSAIASASADIAFSSASLAAQDAMRHCSSGAIEAAQLSTNGFSSSRPSLAASASTAALAAASSPFGSTAITTPSRSPNSWRKARYARMNGRSGAMSESVLLSILRWNAPSHAPRMASTTDAATTARGQPVTSAASRRITAARPRSARCSRAAHRRACSCRDARGARPWRSAYGGSPSRSRTRAGTSRHRSHR